MPYVDKIIDDAKESNEERFFTVDDVPHIVNDVVTGNMQRRKDAQKITGEWLVYANYEGKNYFLCLAKHGDGDEGIRQKINSSCIHEFPFLDSILLK